MIRILVIEDNVEKFKKILSLLTEECNVPEMDIDCADCVRRGREFITKGHYDLLLLDLVLPINEGDPPSAESGIRFLDEIYYNPNINIPVHIIGLTQFDSVFNDCSKEFEDKLWGLINFNLQNTDWIDKLKSKVFYLQSFKKKYKDFIEGEFQYDVAIITAINSEFEQLKNICEWESLIVPNDPLLYYKFLLNTKNNNNLKIVICCVNQMGMQASAAVASKIISLFSPTKFFITGICAGIKSTGVNLGDIVIATQSWDYESGKISEDSNSNLIFKPDMHCLPTDQGILAKLTEFSNIKLHLSKIYNDYKGLKPITQLNVKFGSIGSGPYVLSSTKYLAELLQNDRKLTAIDMEGYGIYKAAQFHSGTMPVFIKAVSDLGDEKKNDDYQDYAAHVSAKFVFDFLYNCF